MQELKSRLKEGLDGTKSFEVLSHEERAKRDCEDLNRKEVGTLHLTDGYECEKCNNRGYAYYTKGAYIYRTQCDCWKPRKTIRRMMESGLANVIKKYTFERYNAEDEWQKHIKEKALKFVSDESAKWFFVGGASGSGKSHICTAICRKFFKTKDVQYMLWEEESKELKSTVMEAEIYQPRMKRLKEVDVLYIDDFFSRHRDDESVRPTDPDIKLARELLNHRYFTEKITIISSEWYSSEIFEIDEALGGRIIEHSGEYCLNVGRGEGKNYRLKMGGVLL